MGRTYSTHRRDQKLMQNIVSKSERKKSLGSSTCREDDNVKALYGTLYCLSPVLDVNLLSCIIWIPAPSL
jgi:hypothetical protein